ncbi:MAG: hemolysin III family protein [Chloroflexi bacterium]|nr:hemolysin III family protein [Chloroflexota bacterium]
MFKKMREPVSGLTHYFAALAAIVGLIVLLVLGRDDVHKQRSLLVYGTSLALTLVTSASYHLIKGRRERIQFLRKIDHAAIYFLIAGTYTPICFNQFTGFGRWGILAIVWSVALAGSITKIFTINAPRWFAAGAYLVMGWLALLMMKEIVRVLPVGALVWLLLGGIIFTLGAVVYMTKIMDFVPGIFGFHEVWHIFVILGCLCHYIMIAVYVAPVPRLL